MATNFSLNLILWTLIGQAAPGASAHLVSLDSQATEATDWSAEQMDLTISLSPKESAMVVEGRFELRNIGKTPCDRLTLVLRREVLGSFLAFDGALRTDRLEPNKTWSPLGNTELVELQLSHPVSPGATHSFYFAYDCQINANQFAVKTDIALGSWVERWYPMVYRPNASPPFTSYLAGRTTFHLPSDWHAVTNGNRLERSSAGPDAVETWESKTAVARSFIAGPYTVSEYQAGDRTVCVYLLSPGIASAHAQAKALAHVIEAMEDRFGPYPYPSYHIAEAPMAYGTWGASSEQGFMMCKPNFFEVEDGNLPLLAHEAAHGWWGNLVGEHGKGGILCSESLAQYGAVVAIEAIEGKRAAAEFLRFSRAGYIPEQCAAAYFEAIKRGLDKPLAQLNGGLSAHGLADAKGHWVFHMLRGRVGDDIFFSTLRGLIKTYAYKRMKLDDLRQAFLASAPPQADLGRFFEQWLDRKGAPTIKLDWHSSGDVLQVSLRQAQEGQAFALDLDLELVNADGSSQRKTVRFDLKHQEFEFQLPNAEGVTEIRMDPEHKLLIWKPEYTGYIEAMKLKQQPPGD